MALPLSLDATGLTIPTIDEVEDHIKEKVWDAFGTTLDLSANTPDGEYISIFSEVVVKVCELLQAIYSAGDPAAAVGDAIAAISQLTGSLREGATPSTVTLTLTGTPATLVAAGSRGGTAAGDEFETLANATIGATATAWASSTAYTLGQRRRNSGRIYEVITPGTSAGSGGPTTTDDDITDGTVHWRYLGDGTGYVDAAAECTEDGPTAAISGTIVEIVTPVAGWSGVINTLDATLGTSVETDAALRERREDEIAQPGTSPVDALRADLLNVEDVTNVVVFNNPTDDTVDTVPPHSVECLIRGGANQDIFDALLAAVAGGIRAFGSVTGTATDEEGFTHDVAFSRPDEIEIYVAINVSVDAQIFPLDGEDQIKAAIVAWGDALKTGYNVHAAAVSAQAFRIAGVLDTETAIGTAPSPTLDTSIVIAARELATFDTSRINIFATAVTP